ncbi:SRP-independent targeting protein 3 homolog [Physcomitrium patens]|uniref:Inorganic phosphate transporter n=1 Tax=Physcomitrium patens TaxID=3218 RepID=A9TYL3_PHYPA|nr:SRP-independent targeting protein 3 homolog [Physcomitrium patens]PNR42647.1 hypothetical protein PHYPA_017477 [Physcomitrium patens]|eukprot:XP_024392391.1 SRP-independent targeting protein 3 homolog [Physcomitrella patens]
MGMSWKMMVGPAMLMGMKAAKIDYDAPHNLLIIRVLYAVSQLALFGALFVIYQRINQEGDEKSTVKVKVTSATGTSEEKVMTHKDYDMSELMKLVKSFGMGAVMTVGIHVYMAVVPALLLQLVTNPMTLWDNALFSIYILKKDSNKDEKLKRPFPSDSPFAKIEAMKKEMAEAEELERKKREEGDQPVIEDTATATGRERVSRAERRPRIRDESSDSDKE